ncbi:Retrovirus-related Pol polyprotein from transposon gypsy [Madurella mycetomatis]|uniref:Retrovirus-related Pol polyprotein from transposon gypsy n=1 Tax=Madurella mycetomatis TaxID=100816 RepID=A0A175VP26_9PEZI|nr:Retrovirus-related Pol polyprotein from transposon gypsy [Madurella mycetomatis]
MYFEPTEAELNAIVFYLKDRYNWTIDSIIPSIQVLLVIFLSYCLIAVETRYGLSEQEVVYLVWAVKKLCTMIHLLGQPITSLDTSSIDRANRRLINASIYLSQYNLKVYYLPSRLNFAKIDPNLRQEGEVIFDSIWFAFTEEFEKAYEKDVKYSEIIKDLKETTKGSGVFSRPGLPFIQINGLLYYIRPDGIQSLCILYNKVKDILELVHDDKHHFGKERMLYNLRGQVKKYVKHYLVYGLNSIDRNPTIGNYQPVRPTDTLPIRVIAIDFIIALRFFNFEYPELNWLDVILSLQWHLNNAYSSPIKLSPYKQLFSFKPASLLEALTQLVDNIDASKI